MATKKASKRFKAQQAKVDINKIYDLDKACELVCSTASAKFDETVEVAVRLGIDARKSEQSVRGSVPLPHGRGKKIIIAVFARGPKADEATKAGADFVGSDDLVEKVKGGFLDFDAVIATPDMMPQIGKIGKILGPKGLMPSPKTGTVTVDVAGAVKTVKAGVSEFRVDKAGVVHAAVGKASFGGAKVKENVVALIDALNRSKPSGSKGVYLQSGSIALTMGPGVRVELAPFRG